MKPLILVLLTLISVNLYAQTTAHIISTHGYDNCIELKNKNVRVVIEPNLGGRVLIYERSGKNVLYIDTTQNGKTLTKDKATQPSAGRFDVGPEATTPKHPLLWAGEWKPEIISKTMAKITSQPDTATGFQIVREFTLSPNSSQLICKQTVTNIAKTTRVGNHWSRTFAVGGGISLTPKNPFSRFPSGYCIYRQQGWIDFKPAPEPNVQVRDGIIEIIHTPSNPKFVMDNSAGWLAYLAQNDLLFVKKYAVYANKPYAEVTAATASIWYFQDKMVEIEPIGPKEVLQPGESFTFTETWWLLDYDFPKDRKADLEQIKGILKSL